MIRRISLACVIWLVYAQSSGLAQDGRLDHVRKDARGEDSSSTHNINLDDDETGFLANLVYNLISGLFQAGSRDGPYYPRYDHFGAYPYYSDFPGYRVPRAGRWPEWLASWDHRVEPLRWSARLSVEDGNDFSGVNRANGQLLLETASGWGFLTSWNQFYERLNAGRSDELVIGDVNVIYSAGLTTDWSVRAGLGFRTLCDHGRSDWGVNVHVGSDIFPVRPMVLSIATDFGNVGSAGVVHGRATIGVIQRGWELFGGYDVLCIGSTTLHGPLLGVRLWF